MYDSIPKGREAEYQSQQQYLQQSKYFGRSREDNENSGGVTCFIWLDVGKECVGIARAHADTPAAASRAVCFMIMCTSMYLLCVHMCNQEQTATKRTPPLAPAGYFSIKHTKGIAYLGPLRVSHASDHISPPSACPGASRRGQQATGLRRAAQGAASVQRSMANKSIRPDDKKAQRQYSRIIHGARDTLRYSRRVADVQRADCCTVVVKQVYLGKFYNAVWVVGGICSRYIPIETRTGDAGHLRNRSDWSVLSVFRFVLYWLYRTGTVVTADSRSSLVWPLGMTRRHALCVYSGKHCEPLFVQGGWFGVLSRHESYPTTGTVDC